MSTGPDSRFQPGILAEIPAHASYLTFRRRLTPGGPREPLARLAASGAGPGLVVGIGDSLVRELGARIEGLGTFPTLSGPGFGIPSTPAALWAWLRAEEPGELVHRTRALVRCLADGFELEAAVPAFRYRGGRDLTGYRIGSENPRGEAARRTAFRSGAGTGLDGSSFAAVQRWVHDLDRFESLSPAIRDRIIGRRLRDNRKLPDGPDASHVQRTEPKAAESPALLLRRSMPWADGRRAGLVFVAFGASLDPFRRHLERMTGGADGIVDHLFRFTRPVTGAFFWCPPVRGGRLDLRPIL